MSPLVCTLPHTNCVFSTALLWCCLPLCFRGTPRPLECDFLKATAAAAAELNCLVLWSNQKRTHNSSGADFLFEWRLCREGLLARKLGQLLSVKDCVRQADPGCGFILKLLVWHAQTHSEFPSQSSALLYFPPTLPACGLVVVTSLHIREGEGEILGDLRGHGGGEEGEGKLRHILGFSNVKPGYCLIHSTWR